MSKELYRSGMIPVFAIIIIVLLAGGAVAGTVMLSQKSTNKEVVTDESSTEGIATTVDNSKGAAPETTAAKVDPTVKDPAQVTATPAKAEPAPVPKTSAPTTVSIPVDWVTFTGMSNALKREITFKHPADIKIETLLGMNFPSGPRILSGGLYPCELYVVATKNPHPTYNSLAETQVRYGMTVEKYDIASTGALDFYYITTSGESQVTLRLSTPGKGGTVATSCNLDLALKIATTVK